MLFDEPTAHLDVETEYELKQAMLPLMEEKLVFFATHIACIGCKIWIGFSSWRMESLWKVGVMRS